MGAFYWIRVAMMILAFFGIVMTIRSLNSGQQLQNPIVNMLTQGENQRQELVVTLCPTRVTAIQVTGGRRIFEEKMKWYAENQGPRVALEPIAVEKWLGSHCSIRATEVTGVASDGFSDVLAFSYVDGESAALRRGTGENADLYQWKSVTFKSTELNEALRTLSTLPTVDKTAGPL